MDAPPLHYARTQDGISIAYTRFGSGPVLVETPLGGGSAVQNLRLSIPAGIDYYEQLSRSFTVVSYDARGFFDSAEYGGEYSVETALHDLTAVIEAVDADKICLLGLYSTSAAAMQFAADNPKRVSRLAVFHPLHSGSRYDESAAFPSMRDMIRADFELYMRQVISVTGLDVDWVDRQLEDSVAGISPETFSRYTASFDQVDVSEALASLAVPTLVLHERTSRFSSPELSRDAAAAIRGAQLAVLDGQAWVPQNGEHGAFLKAVTEFFLGGDSDTAAQSGFRAILFTDVVASTPLLAQLKDARMREVMRDHDAVLQAAVDEHGGRVIKTIGDAFMAEFAVPSAAVECAIAMQRGIQAQFADSDVPIRLRIGINAGEPVEQDGDLHGISVNIAKRLESAAETNGILVSDVVKAAVAGKDFAFVNEGEVSLKGLDEPVRAWSVEWV